MRLALRAGLAARSLLARRVAGVAEGAAPQRPLGRTGEPALAEAVADSVDAVVLVGGLGTRLRPLTLSAPKPMLPTAGAPLLAHLLSRIRDAGVRHVVLGTSYQASVFAEHFGDGSPLGLEIEYVVEDEPLGTGGGDPQRGRPAARRHAR